MNALAEINKLFDDFSQMLITLTKTVYSETYGYLLKQTAQLSDDLIALADVAAPTATTSAPTLATRP